MEKYYIATGKTIDLAIQAGLNALGMDRDSVSVEVLENAKTGFLGIGASPAKVKVTYEVPDEVKPTPALSAASRSKPKKKDAAESAAPKVVDLPKASPKPTPKPQEQKPAPAKSAPKAQAPKSAAKPQEAKPAPKAQEPKQKAAETQSAPAPAQSNEGKGTPRRSNDRRRQSKPKPDTVPQAEAAPKPEKPKAAEPKAAPVVYAPAAPGSTEERIEQFIQGLLQHMGSQAVPHAVKTEEDTYHVELVGENLGMLIGRRGDTLDAIQHLTNYAVNRDAAKRARITVDAESYREKREEALKRLARKVAGKVVRYRHNITLEPMNAYERHVIHAELQDVPEVFTFSTGSEPNRRVVVSYNRNQKESNTQ